MRLTRIALALGFVTVAAGLGCGGGGGGVRLSGDGSADSGSKYTGFAGILASCGYPACYLDLLLPCLPEGACVEQTTATCGASACPTPPTTMPTSETIGICYGNGVKILEEIDMSNLQAMAVTATWKKGSTVCLTTAGLASSNGVSTTTVKNAAGTTVATAEGDMTARTETITCVGASPVVVSMDCLMPDGGTSSGSGNSCTKGICTF